MKSSAYKNIKELIPPASDIRVLFVFDPERTAVLLLGSDKTGAWGGWYRENVPLADALYRQYLHAQPTPPRPPATRQARRRTR